MDFFVGVKKSGAHYVLLGLPKTSKMLTSTLVENLSFFEV